MPTVKKLEWLNPIGSRGWIASPMPGVNMFYKIQKLFASGQYLAHFPTHQVAYLTLEAAQGACNEDWSKRVKATLEECDHVYTAVEITPGAPYSASIAQCAKCGYRPTGIVST